MDFWIYAVFLLHVVRLATTQRFSIENVQSNFRNIPPPRLNWKQIIQKLPDSFNGGQNYGNFNEQYEQPMQGLPQPPPQMSPQMPPPLPPHMLPPPPPHMAPPSPPHMVPLQQSHMMPPPPPQMAPPPPPPPPPPQPLPPSPPSQSFMRNVATVEFQSQRMSQSNSAPMPPPPPSNFRNRQEMYEPLSPNSPCPYCGRYGNAEENVQDYSSTEECPCACECEGCCACENDYPSNPPQRGSSTSGNGEGLDYATYEEECQCPCCCQGNCGGNDYEGGQDYSYDDEPEPAPQSTFSRYSTNSQINTGSSNYQQNSQVEGRPSQSRYSPPMQIPPPPPPPPPPRQLQGYTEIQDLPQMMMSSNTQLLDMPPRGMAFSQGQGRMRSSQGFQQIMQRPVEMPPQSFPPPPPIPIPPPSPSSSRVMSVVNRYNECRHMPSQSYEGEMARERPTFSRPMFKEMNRRGNSYYREERPKPTFFDNLAYSDSC